MTFEHIREVLTVAPAVTIKAGGLSMAPVIRDNDAVILEKTDTGSIRRGDIILFGKDSRLIAHRVIRRSDCSGKTEFLTKGDAAFDFDGTIAADRVLGKIISVARNNRTVFLDSVLFYRLIRSANVFFPRLMILVRRLKFFLFVKPLEKTRKSNKCTRADRLLALCARTDIDNSRRQEIEDIVCEGLDWRYFLDEVKKEGLSSLVYKALGTIAGFFDRTPGFVHGELKNTYYCTARINILFLEALEELSARLRQENIPAIIIKGLLLLELVYADLGARAMSDIDIVVKKQDVSGVSAVLEKMGYRCAMKVDDGLLSGCFTEHNSLLFVPRKDTPVYFHILWHYINSPVNGKKAAQKIDMDLIWKESEEVRVGNAVLRTFSAHHQLIYLCAHAMRHAYRPMTLLCDIREFLRANKNRIDWDRTAAEATRYGLNKQLYYGLYLAKEVIGADVTDEILIKLKPEKRGFLERRLIAACARRKLKLDGGELIFFSLNDGVLQKARFIARALFPSRTEMALIKQKDASRVTVFDYLARMYSACAYAVKSLPIR